MKAITLHQPWATLVAIGAKQYETRSWTTLYRGPLAIHAGKNTEELKHMAYWFQAVKQGNQVAIDTHGMPWWFRKVVNECGRYGDNLTLGNTCPRGVIVCTCELVAIHDTWPLSTLISTQEKAFGNWADGRYAWQLDNVNFLGNPIPARGQQGLWNWEG